MFFSETKDFFREVRLSVAAELRHEYRPVPRKPQWWITRHAEAWEQLTGKRLKNTCPFFWGAIRYFLYTLTKNVKVADEMIKSISVALFLFGWLVFWDKVIGGFSWRSTLIWSISACILIYLARIGLAIFSEARKAAKKPADPSTVSNTDKEKLTKPRLSLADWLGWIHLPKIRLPQIRLPAWLANVGEFVADLAAGAFDLLADIFGSIFEHLSGVKDAVCPPME